MPAGIVIQCIVFKHHNNIIQDIVLAGFELFDIKIATFVSFWLYSDSKSCLADKRVAFVGDSRIRQLSFSFTKIINPERKEEGNKVESDSKEKMQNLARDADTPLHQKAHLGKW